MDKYAKQRWTVLLSALAATIGAMVYPADEPSTPVMPTVASPQPNPAVKLVSAPATVDHARPAWVASDDNPFGPRVWTAALPVAEVNRTVEPVEATPAAPEAPPPPLPYRFLGQMQDGPSRVIYLGRGEEVILARQNDVLEGSYKVVAVNDSAIEFESVQSGIKQSLPIPAQ